MVYTCDEAAIILLGLDTEAASHPASISHNDYFGMDDHRIDEKKTKLIGTYVCAHHNRYVHTRKSLLPNQYTLRRIAAERSHSCSSLQ